MQDGFFATPGADLVVTVRTCRSKIQTKRSTMQQQVLQHPKIMQKPHKKMQSSINHQSIKRIFMIPSPSLLST